MDRHASLTTLAACLSLVILTASTADAQDLYLPRVTPSLSVSGAWGGRMDARSGDWQENESPFVSFWLGANVHPVPAVLSPFASAGLELEPHSGPAGGGSVIYVMPMARAGVSWNCMGIGKNGQVGWVDSLLPCLSAYTVGGIRPAARSHGTTLRAGLGVSSPALFVFGLAAELLLPSSIEAMIEVEADGSLAYLLRIGIGI